MQLDQPSRHSYFCKTTFFQVFRPRCFTHLVSVTCVLRVSPISPTPISSDDTPWYFTAFFSRPVTGLWTAGEKKAKFGYDYWYQPYWDVMISSEWGAPKSFKKGFSLPDVQDEGSAQDSQYTGCPRRNVPDFGRVFLMLKYTDITQNTYVQSWTVTEIMARERCGLLAGPRTVPVSWQTYPCHSLSVVSYYGNSAHTHSKLFMYFLLGDKAVHGSAWHSCHV